jgi:DNA-binding CsgD family transcriptional regulator
MVELAAGEAEASLKAGETAWQQMSPQEILAAGQRVRCAEAALAIGDLALARSWTDEAMPLTQGWHLAYALVVRARVSLLEGHPAATDRDARQALSCVADCGTYLQAPDALECLAAAVSDQGAHGDAARLLAAATAIRDRAGMVRFAVDQASYRGLLAKLREELEPDEFDAAWSEGDALTVDEAIAFATRSRGPRQRPDAGWPSLTPAELDVVRLVCEGLGNKDVAARLFVSPRTVQAHLSHIYTKLGLTSRVQLVQEAARHS